MNFKVIPLGGASEVGANSFYICGENFNLLLDCGMLTKGDILERKPLYEKIRREIKLDAIIISHAHLDHIGSLPIAKSKFPNVPIYMTEDTLKMTKISLEDSNRVMNRENENIYFQDYYTEKKLEELSNSITTLEYNKKITIKENENIKIEIEFYNAGHIRGSAMTMINITENNNLCSILYTGDINLVDTLCEKAVDIKQLPHNPHLLICESTYGNKIAKPYNRTKEIEKFAKIINETHNNNGCVLIPSFALGRTQEIVATINYLLVNKKIDKKTKINVIGLSSKYSEYYPEMNNYDWNILESISQETIKKDSEKKSIFIASNGMMKTGTPSHRIASYLVGDKNSTIIFPGYLDPQSEGANLFNNRKYRIKNKNIDVLCKVDKIQFSSHASKNDLEKLLLEIKPASSIYIHGDEDSVQNMQNFSKDNNIESSAPLFNGESTIVLQNKSNVKLIQTGKTNAVITIMGTSVITNYLRNKNHEKYSQEDLFNYIDEKESAETETIKKLIKQNKISINDCFYLITTDTPKGKIASNVIKQYLQDKLNINYVEINFIRHLTEEAAEIQSKGITNFIDIVTNIINEHKDACIVATGGFKVEMSFATLIGLIYSKPIFYIHEMFSTIIETPQLPFVPDFSEYKIYRDDIDFLLRATPSKENNNKYKSLPPTVQKMLVQSKKTGIFEFTTIGKIVSNFYNHQQTKKDKIIINQDAIITDLWNIVDENKKITLNDMKDYALAKQLKSILKSPYVKYIKFENLEKNTFLNDLEGKMVFVNKTNGLLKYTLYLNNTKQDILIHVMPSFESCVEIKIPKEIKINIDTNLTKTI